MIFEDGVEGGRGVMLWPMDTEYNTRDFFLI